MRTRRWILVSALVVAFTALLIYHSWNILSVNERIKKYVLLKIEPALGADFQIKKLDMSLGAVHLKNVEVKSNDLLLQIEDVRIGFNFTNLVKNSFRPQKIPHDILFIKPHLIIQPELLKSWQNSEKNPSDLNKVVSHHEYWSKIKEFDFIKRITISKGKISYADSISHSVIPLAQDINGWLSSMAEGLISARLVGKLFQSGTYNLYINAGVDLSQEHFDLLDIKVNNYAWKNKFPLFIPDNLDIKKGLLNGAITVTKNKINDNSEFAIKGEISIGDGAVIITDKNLYFDKINIKATIADRDCILENSGFIFNGSYVEIAGKIKNFFSPQLDLTLTADHFDLRKNLSYMAPDSRLNLGGHSILSLHIANSVHNPVITGQILSPQIVISEKSFQQLKTVVSFQDSILKIPEFSSNFEGLELTGYGELDFSGPSDSVSFSITGAGALFPAVVPLSLPSVDNSESCLQIHGKGSLSRVSGAIDFSLKASSHLNTSYQLNGDYAVQKKTVSFDLNSTSHRFAAEGAIRFSNKRPEYQIKLTDFQNIMYSLPELGPIQKIFNYKTSIIQIRNDQSEWIINGRYDWKEPAARTAIMKCRIKSQDTKKRIDANFDIYGGSEKFVGQLNVIKTPAYWEIISFNIENIFQSNGRIHLGEGKQIEANIIFPDASLPKLGNLIFGHSKSIDQGKLYGFINVSGSLENPRMSGNFDVAGVVLNQIGSYDGGLTFQLVDKKLLLNEITIALNQQALFSCYGWYAVDKDQLNFDFLGQNIDLNSIMTTAFNKPGLVEGKGATRIQLKGNLNRPKIYGKIDIETGRLGPFPFNQAQLDLGQEALLDLPGGNFDSDSLAASGVIFKNILVNRIGQFAIQGKGVIPYSSQKPMAIELNGEGNILSLLPDLTPFFKQTRSNGEWSVNVAGRPKNIVIAGGKIELSDGYLRLREVAPEINNIAADIELEQDGFLNVKFISGKIKGKPFTFRNFRPDSAVNDALLETFSIPELGLDFGIFTLETTSKGVPLRIPGLMKKKEFGHFVFAGKNDKEKFYFAGPLEKPIVKGKIQPHNANFTFPFIGSNAADTTQRNPVVEVLTHINWDVNALAGKDLHYQREFPSGVDNAYLDLTVDAGVGGLDFKGVISDSSFGVTGSLQSSHGNVEYLDLNFEVIKAGVEFDPDISPESDVVFNKNSLLPIIYGEARTTVTDSTGYPYYVYLTLLTVDHETGYALKRGRLGDVKFQLSADNPSLGMGYTEGELLASLGYSSANIPKMATNLIGISADNLLFRRLFRPFERQLERAFGLDMVRFSSRFTRNLIEMNLNDERNFQLDSRLFLLRNTKLMLGKYLIERLFLLYTGQLEAGMDYRYQQEGFGFRHTLGLEYRINPSLFLQMQYDYDSLLLWQKDDKRIMLRHSFPF